MECFSHLVQIIGETCYRVLSNILEHSYILSLTLLLIDPIQFSSIATSYFFRIIGMLHIYVFQSVFFFLSLHFLTFTEATAAPLSSCTNNGTFKCGTHFQCGNLSGIGYPFWGNNRPSYCGKPDFELSCFQENITEIQINSKTYRVLDVIQEKQALRIARMDFWNDACPSPLEDTSSLNSTVFNYLIPSTKNLSLYYDCAVSAVTDPTLFTCVDAARISDAYFVNESVLPVQGKRHLEACKVGIQVPVIDKALKSLLSGQLAIWEVFREGFDVVYYDATKEFDCSSCEMSGGECGYDLVNQKSVCFPHDRDDKTKCAPNPNGTAAQAEAGVASHGVRVTVKIGIVMSVVGALVIAAGGITFYVLKKKKTKNSENLEEFLKAHGALAPKRYKYSEVRKMTEGFQDKLGQGGYGSVYKGKLPDGRMVAVKLLDETKGNGDDFINEVASISRTSHVNVVALLGFCVEGSKRALVYEFVPNGSLEKFIYLENPQLGWETLYKIAIGIARGLEYLHRGCYTRILHFDIKPHNILLDQDFSPKISDFGLAKLSYGKESIVSMTRARGTVGYIAPEVVSRNFGGVSYKADVYSYGMMVLEMVGGRKNLDPKVHNPSEIYFPTWIYKRLNLNEDLGLHEVTNAEEEEIARKMIIVGLSCIQNYPSDRPAMSGVLEMLEGKVEALQIPPKLFESSPTSREQEDTSPTISIS